MICTSSIILSSRWLSAKSWEYVIEVEGFEFARLIGGDGTRRNDASVVCNQNIQGVRHGLSLAACGWATTPIRERLAALEHEKWAHWTGPPVPRERGAVAKADRHAV